jgi:hypothetical protein
MARGGAERHQPLHRLRTSVVNGEPVAGLDEAPRHVGAHVTEPDEANVHVREAPHDDRTMIVLPIKGRKPR